MVILTDPQSPGMPTTGTVPFEAAMVTQTMPPTVPGEEYLSTPAFMRKNTESDIYVLLPTPEGDAQRYRPFRCILNPTDIDGRRRAPEWLGPEQELPPVSMRKILGVLLIGRRVDGSAGHGVGGSTRVSLGLGESSSDAAAHDVKKMKLEVLSEAISRDYRTHANKDGRGEEVWAYESIYNIRHSHTRQGHQAHDEMRHSGQHRHLSENFTARFSYRFGKTEILFNKCFSLLRPKSTHRSRILPSLAALGGSPKPDPLRWAH